MSDREHDWLGPLLALARPPERAEAGFRRAAGRASALLSMRQARQESARFARPLSVRSYLARLAESAGVSSDEAAEWAGLPPVGPIDEAFARAWGRLASALRLDWPEARVYLRLEAADAAGVAWSAPPAMAARGGQTPAQALRAAERVADAAVAGLDAESLDRAEEAARSQMD